MSPLSQWPDIDRSRDAMRRRIAELNNKQCETVKELQATLSELAILNIDFLRIAIAKSVLDAFGNLVRRTPVDTGRARASWMLSNIDTSYIPKEGQYPEYKNDGSIKSAINEALQKSVNGRLSDSDIIYVYSNVEYMLALNAGWSKKLPGGFIDLFLQELKSQLEGVAESFKEKS